jgi:hypothetical protein
MGLPAAARFRRCASIVLGAALGLMLVEAGIHSVHHLSNPTAAQRCVHAAAALHLVGPAHASEDTHARWPLAMDEVPLAAIDDVAVHFQPPPASRAPPIPSSTA